VQELNGVDMGTQMHLLTLLTTLEMKWEIRS
jgi:hypothetical protein